MASLVLKKRGFDVRLYEQYPSYTRNVQWTVRQIFIDYLSHVDKEIAKEFVQLVSPIKNGFRKLSDKSLRFPDGAYSHEEMEGPKERNARDREKSCAEALKIPCEKAFREFPPVGIIRTQDFENFFRGKIQKMENITVISKKAPKVRKVGKRYVLVEDGAQKKYDLIVVCEGARSQTRRDLRIRSIPLSRVRKQISGDVTLGRHGMIITYQHAKQDKVKASTEDKDKAPTELLLSLVLSTNDTKTSCWVIGDVSSEVAAKIDELELQIEDAEHEIARLVKEIKAAKTQRSRLALESKKAKTEADKLALEENKPLVEELEFREIAARTMLDTERNIAIAGHKGPVGVRRVESFEIQARISNIAYAGENLVLAGDAVGEGHWSVGGGMHVAGMFHQRHLDVLAAAFRGPGRRLDALKKYNKGVLDDTKTWISLGIKDYYLSIPPDVLRRVFKRLVEEDLQTKDKNFDVPRQIREQVAAVYFD